MYIFVRHNYIPYMQLTVCDRLCVLRKNGYYETVISVGKILNCNRKVLKLTK